MNHYSIQAIISKLKFKNSVINELKEIYLLFNNYNLYI